MAELQRRDVRFATTWTVRWGLPLVLVLRGLTRPAFATVDCDARAWTRFVCGNPAAAGRVIVSSGTPLPGERTLLSVRFFLPTSRSNVQILSPSRAWPSSRGPIIGETLRAGRPRRPEPGWARFRSPRRRQRRIPGILGSSQPIRSSRAAAALPCRPRTSVVACSQPANADGPSTRRQRTDARGRRQPP